MVGLNFLGGELVGELTARGGTTVLGGGGTGNRYFIWEILVI